MMFSGIRYENDTLFLIDQRRLPHEEEWLSCLELGDVIDAIASMAVRGAPAIATAAAFGVVLSCRKFGEDQSWQIAKSSVFDGMKKLAQSRPTAVNLFHAIHTIKREFETLEPTTPMGNVAELALRLAQTIFQRDLETCKAIGEHGASLWEGNELQLMTHCNTGSLATSGYGTALGVVRSLHAQGRLKNLWAGETRPWLQGARLTMFELMQDQIPCSLIVDSAAGFLMSEERISGVVVGADRIAENGDTANKIGTLNLAILAKHFGVPFVVTAPNTIDLNLPEGAKIPIEHRSSDEVVQFRGHPVAPEGSSVLNPAFDVTPHSLIDAIVTENGVCRAPFSKSLKESCDKKDFQP